MDMNQHLNYVHQRVLNKKSWPYPINGPNVTMPEMACREMFIGCQKDWWPTWSTPGCCFQVVVSTLFRARSRPTIHGCCWETFYIFAYCGNFAPLPTSTKNALFETSVAWDLREPGHSPRPSTPRVLRHLPPKLLLRPRGALRLSSGRLAGRSFQRNGRESGRPVECGRSGNHLPLSSRMKTPAADIKTKP